MPPNIPPSEPIDSTQTDTDLVRALRAGHVVALGILYDRYADNVYGLAYRLMMNAEEAEDLTQEVFLALQTRSLYNPARGSLISFLMTMTRSRAIDRLRSRSSKLRFLQRWQGAQQTQPASTPLEFASQSEQAEVIQQAMAQLPATERQVLESAYYEGLSQSEIAKQLDMPLGTVKTRSRQGLTKLRRALQHLIE
jgi:RNA polymerase sigma-70 factor (ECF subfamily)